MLPIHPRSKVPLVRATATEQVMIAIDMTGKRYGKLVAIEKVLVRGLSRQRVCWRCKCDCGRETVADGMNMRNGMTKSCGCRRLDVCDERAKHRKCATPEYKAWAQMMARCYRRTSADNKNWGGRGIRVCDKWKTAANFLVDMGERPTPKHSLDRINNDGNYEPSNCRWATRIQQNNNRRPFKNRITTCAL